MMRNRDEEPIVYCERFFAESACLCSDNDVQCEKTLAKLEDRGRTQINTTALKIDKERARPGARSTIETKFRASQSHRQKDKRKSNHLECRIVFPSRLLPTMADPLSRSSFRSENQEYKEYESRKHKQEYHTSIFQGGKSNQ